MANSFQQEQETPELEMLSELAENLVYRLPRCEEVMIRKTVQEVFREFCRETKCLTAERMIDLKPGERHYPLAAVFGGVVTGVRTVTIGCRRLRLGFDYVTQGANPLVLSLWSYWVRKEPCCVPLAEAHIHAKPYVMRVLQEEVPSLNSEKVPRGFIDLNGEAICSGVIARLCAMSGRSWSDPQVAALERVNYENAKSEMRMKMETPLGGRFIDTSQVL